VKRSGLFGSRPAPLPPKEILLLAKQFGVHGSTSELSSERDQNVLIEASTGKRYVLKISHPAEPVEIADFEAEVMEHVQAVAPLLPVPRVVRSNDGCRTIRHRNSRGAERAVRMISFLGGVTLSKAKRSAALRTSIGVSLGALDNALHSVPVAAQKREMVWDFEQASGLREFLRHVADARLRLRLIKAFDALETSNFSSRGDLRRQWLHNDFNPNNLLVSEPASPAVCGIIDFGDMIFGALVGDVAVACAYAMEAANPLDSMLDVIEGFQSNNPLTQAELELLPTLVATRVAMTIVIAAWRVTLDPDNREYILRNYTAAVEKLEAIQEMSTPNMGAVVSHRLTKGG